MINVYGAIPEKQRAIEKRILLLLLLNEPKRMEKKKVFFGTFNNGHARVMKALGLMGTIRIKSRTKKR